MKAADRWVDIYDHVPLHTVPRHYAGMSQSPFLMKYLTEVLRLCPEGGSALETGIGSGYGAVWLSRRGISAAGIDFAPLIVERAKQVNNVLGGDAKFRIGDLFDLCDGANRYNVIHHQGVLEHFTAPQIRAALAQQVASADWVVFSVPSVYYPFDAEFGDERFLPLEEWRRILEPFDIQELKYYGDPQHGEIEQILCVLRGQKTNPALSAMMRIPQEPFPFGISGIVHTRNESRNIAACLETLRPWCDEIIVCDMESEDDTVAIAWQYTDNIVHHPRIANFDRARNVSAMRAGYGWVFYLDADERVPEALGRALREIVTNQPGSFEAMLIPFQHYFSGHWMQCLYPGYTAPRLLKNGKFTFNARLHSGARVDGRDQPLRAATSRRFPQRFQRALDLRPVAPPTGKDLNGLGRRTRRRQSVQKRDRVFAIVTGCLNKLIQNLTLVAFARSLIPYYHGQQELATCTYTHHYLLFNGPASEGHSLIC